MNPQPCQKCFGTGTRPDHVEIGRLRGNERRAARLSIYVVSERMGIDPSYLSYLEAGKRGWSQDLLDRFAEAIRRGQPCPEPKNGGR